VTLFLRGIRGKLLVVPARDLIQRDAGPGPALGESRSRVLELLQQADGPLGVGDVAAAVGLHSNTARFHLDALVEAGSVQRSTQEREQPGRPRALYAATPDGAGAGQRSYRLLAEILASYFAAEVPHPAEMAQQAGRAWGRYLADRPPPFGRIDAAAATRQLVHTLAEIGFAPEATMAGGTRAIRLHHCPFRESAEAHREVVCSVHLGLMQGVLAEIDAPLDAERLDAFVEPSLCIAQLAARPSSD
jgi:predicted ArsR family transcriptional regulator